MEGSKTYFRKHKIEQLMVGNKMKILAIRESNPFIQSSASANRFLSIIQGLKKNDVKIDLLFPMGKCRIAS